MSEILEKYLPSHSVIPVFKMIEEHRVHLKIVNERVTRHGDYKRMPNGVHQITVNSNLNKFRFLITLVHEISHLVAFEKFGRRIKPHGKEWKFTFQQLMLPFIRPQIFPDHLLPLIAQHFRNPKASSDTDARLAVALKEYDAENDKTYVFELPTGGLFRIYNGKIFKKGEKLRKRYECKEVSSGRTYLFQPNAQVEFIMG